MEAAKWETLPTDILEYKKQQLNHANPIQKDVVCFCMEN